MRRYTPEMHAFIRENVVGRTAAELAQLVSARFGIDVTPDQMHSYKNNHHLKSGTTPGLPKGYPSRKFPQAVRNFILAEHRGISREEMAHRLNQRFGTTYTTKQIAAFYKNNGICNGRDGRFPKGSIPINKGKTWDEFMTPEGQAASRKTQYKKGNLPPNTRPIGWERVSKDGYIYVKVAMRPSRTDCNDNFVLKHHLVWEQANGPLPAGHCLVFKNGNKQDVRLENLMCVSMSDRAVMCRRGLFSNVAEATEVGVTVAKLLRATASAEKNKKRREKDAVSVD